MAPQPHRCRPMLNSAGVAAAVLLLFSMTCAQAWAAAAQSIHWHTRWDQALFAQAAREHRFVLLDLHAVWCHWCHVMDEETYANAQVIGLIGKRYLAVSV